MRWMLAEACAAALLVLAGFTNSLAAPDVGTSEESLAAAVASAEERVPRDAQALVEALIALAEFQEKRNRPRDAIVHIRRAVEVLETSAASDDINLARALLRLNFFARETGGYREALAVAERSLAIYRRVYAEPHVEIAIALSEVGLTHRMVGNYQEARRSYEESLAIGERISPPDLRGQNITLHNLGAVLRLMDEPELALVHLRRALAQEEKLNGPDHPDVAVRLNVTALAYEDLGDYAVAIGLLERALQISEKALGPDHRTISIRLNNLAGTLNSLGQHERALELYQRALRIDEKTYGQVHASVAIRLNGIAYTLKQMNRLEEAEMFSIRALTVGEQALGPENVEVSVWLNNLAQIYRAKGDTAKALPLYQRGIGIQISALGPSHVRVAGSLLNLAGAQFEAGERDAAFDSVQRALGILSVSPRPDAQWRAEAAMRRIYEVKGQSDLSIYWGKQAVNTIQSQRVRLSSLPQELQRSYFTDKRKVYVALTDQLIAAGRLAEAQEVLAMLKEEELFDFIQRSGDDARSSRATFVGRAEVAANARWREASEYLSRLGNELAELSRKARLGLTAEEIARRKQVEADLALARQRMDGLIIALSAEFESANQPSKGAMPNAPSLASTQALLRSLGGDVALLNYVVSDHRVAIILTTPTVQVARESRIAATELNAKVLAFRQVIAERKNAMPLAQELYRLLYEPIAADLGKEGSRLLMLSLDGALRYLPFSALHDGSAYLIERHALSVFTDAARTYLSRRPQKSWSMTGLGLTRAVPGFVALPAVREELESVRRAAVAGDVYLDEQFTVDRLLDALTSGRPVLHIASHFQFRPGTYANSFLVLGDGGRLTLKEVRDRKLQFTSLDLLTLSACDTAQGGGQDETGAEVEGFGALAQRQGAHAVLATLWRVGDASTGRFMQLIYAPRQGESEVTKADSLRLTQLAFIKGIDPQARGRYQHPYFWAPYVLMGN